MTDSAAQPVEPVEHANAPEPRDARFTPRPPVLVAVCAWLVPGLGYWILGLRARGLTVFVTILLLFVLGVFIGGIRVIDVPGYDPLGQPITLRDGQWVLTAHPMRTVLQKPWYIGQILAGPITLAGSYASIEAARHEFPKAVAHVADIGTLYTAVAGMLNLLTIIDATGRAAASRK